MEEKDADGYPWEGFAAQREGMSLRSRNGGKPLLSSIIVHDMFNAETALEIVLGKVMRAAVMERHGPTLVFKDEDGLRHAVKASAVLAASDADDGRDATVMQLPGARFLVVSAPLEDILPVMSGLPLAPAPAQSSEEEVRRLRLVVANLRLVWLKTMSALLEEGVLPSTAFRGMRERCLQTVGEIAGSGNEHLRALGAEGAKDIADLFASLLPCEKAGS